MIIICFIHLSFIHLCFQTFQRPSLLQRLMGAVLPSHQGSLNLEEEQFEDADSHLPLSRQGSLHRSTLR